MVVGTSTSSPPGGGGGCPFRIVIGGKIMDRPKQIFTWAQQLLPGAATERFGRDAGFVAIAIMIMIVVEVVAAVVAVVVGVLIDVMMSVLRHF